MRSFYQNLLILCVLFIPINVIAQNPINPYKAPLYWSVYENNYLKEKAGQADNYIAEEEFSANIDWVEKNLKPSGYTMICTDGWGDINQINENGYRLSHSTHWKHNFAWWSNQLQQKGMSLGIYSNPLWIHVADNDTKTFIKGTNILVSSLKNPNENAAFPWCQVQRPGAEEYVKGYVQFYADMGVKYLRVDFLSWYETGTDRYLGKVGPSRPHADYETALRWMREACDANGMFLSLVMPNLFNDAETEQKYGHMVRINEDTGDGAWYKFSEKDRGVNRNGWSKYANAFDGYIYWSKIAGKGKMILDGDFIRLNTYANDEERKSVISLHMIAGGPVTVSDQYTSISTSLWAYTNPELIALSQDGVVGSPLSYDPTQSSSQIWKGQMSNGDWIVALFNRENDKQPRTISFSDLGLNGLQQVRDLWAHSTLGQMASFTADIPAHGCRVLKISPLGVNVSGRPAMHVANLIRGTETSGGQARGTATIEVKDANGNPVSGAEITVRFSASFHEDCVGITDGTGTLKLMTSSEVAADQIKTNIEILDIRHKEYIYSGDQNSASSIGDNIFIGATFNNWSPSSLPMLWSAGKWIARDVDMKAGAQQMKFANSKDWTGSDWGNASGWSGTVSPTTGGGNNITFSIVKPGKYTIIFDEKSLQYTIVSQHEKEMYIGGSFNNWTPTATPMSLQNDVWVAENVAINAGSHELKFANTSNWSGNDWGISSGTAGTAQLSTGGKPNLTFSVANKGWYKITFDDQSLTYSIGEKITAVDDVQNESVSVYPNPASDKLTLRLGNDAPTLVSINSILGELLYETQTGESTIVLDLNSLNVRGLVLVKISTKKQTKYFKVFVK